MVAVLLSLPLLWRQLVIRVRDFSVRVTRKNLFAYARNAAVSARKSYAKVVGGNYVRRQQTENEQEEKTFCQDKLD